MFNLSVTACSFKLRKRNKKGINVLRCLNGDFVYKKGQPDERIVTSAIGLFEDFFTTYNKYENDQYDKKLFSCTFNKEDSGEDEHFKYLIATIHSGSYGFPSIIVDSDSKQELMETTNKQATVKNFYVMVVVPKDSEDVEVVKGLLLFQNIGQYGIKTITTKYISQHFADCYGLTTICGNISPNVFIDKLLENNAINQLILTKNFVSDDEADSKGYGKEVRVLSKFKHKESLLSKIRSFASGSCSTYEFEGIDYDSTKLYVDIGGRFRTIDLHNIENLSVIEAIPDEYLLADGTVKKQGLIDYFKTLAQEYINTMSLGD